MARQHRLNRFWRIFDVRGIEIEVFVAGVLAILLALASVQAFLPAFFLPAAGVFAFAALILAGIRLGPNRRRLTPAHLSNRDTLFRIAAVAAIAWIAAGRLYGADL